MPVASPTPATIKVSSQTINGQTLYVTNTDGLGVYIRRTPNPVDRVTVWPDGTPMVVVGPDQPAGGQIWKNVRDPNNDVGFVPAQYLTSQNPAFQSATVEANSRLVFVGTPRYVLKPAGGVVEGLVQNTGSRTRTGILRALLVDAGGNSVGVANGIVNDVAPGGTGVYVLFTTQRVTQVARIVPEVAVSRAVSSPAHIAVQDVSVQASPTGPLVVGKVVNQDADSYSVAVVAGYLSNGNQLVGTARGIVDALGPGQSRSFTLRPDEQITGYSRIIVQVAAVSQIQP